MRDTTHHTLQLYVYGITAPGLDTIEEPGVGDPPAPVRMLAGDGLVAVASPLPGGYVPGTRHDLVAHQTVLAAVVRERDVIPMQFGVVLPSEDAVVDLLSRHHDEFESVLDDIAGCIEIDVTVLQDEDRAIADVIAGDRGLDRLRRRARTVDDKIRLGEAVAMALEDGAARDGAAVLDHLQPLSVATSVGQSGGTRVVLKASFLVERDAIDRFDEALDALGDRCGDHLRIRVVAPLPAYSFTKLHLHLDEEGDRWAS